MGLVKVPELIKINQIIIIKTLKNGYLPQTIEPLFLYKSDADERLTIGYQNQFATQLPGNYKIGIRPINEASKSWNTCPEGINFFSKIRPN